MTAKRPFRCVAILGLGLMGGSLGLAIKRKKLAGAVVGYARRAKTRQQALAAGVVDKAFAHPAAAIRSADLVVFCVPVTAILSLAKTSAASLAPNTIVTDVGSSKETICAHLEPLLHAVGACFVGSHPICGSEQEGLDAAWPRLYEKAAVIVTPTPQTNQLALRKIKRFWRGLGSQVLMVSPKDHDRLLGRTSHLPHLVAALLATTVGRASSHRIGRFCGPGFRDATRIAEGSPSMWQDTILTNRLSVLSELKAFHSALKRLQSCLLRNDAKALQRFLEASRRQRQILVRDK